MRSLRARRRLCVAFITVAFASPAFSQTPPQPAAARVFPGTTWDSIRNPREIGWSRGGLDSVRALLSTYATTGMMAVVGGRVLMSYGDLDTLTYLASARKSVLSLLIGKYVKSGVIDLNKNLAQIGIDDIGGLSAKEKQATVKDLLTARSGIYHPASNAGDNTNSAPPRGSQTHGTYFLYNNWDFNALGGVFERVTGRDIYDALETDLARPIGMQDFDRAQQRKSGDATRSRFLAYHMLLSTRDMARIGLLTLRRGQWNGVQVVPADWVDETTKAFTHKADMNPSPLKRGVHGYGYLWWVWEGPESDGPLRGMYSAQGAYGQFILVVPEFDLVVAHKTAPEQRTPAGQPFQVGGDQFFRMIEALLGARCGSRCPAQ